MLLFSPVPSADGIGGKRENDRHGTRRLQQRPHGRRANGHNYVGCERDQFLRVPANFSSICRGPSDVDAHVSADAPARLLQPLKECPEAGLKFRIFRS